MRVSSTEMTAQCMKKEHSEELIRLWKAAADRRMKDKRDTLETDDC